MPTVRLDGARLCDWDAFHTVFASAFGFPDFYGRNLNAWIDCMPDLGEDTGMTTVRGSASDSVVLYLDNANTVPKEIFDALLDCVGFVNWRNLESGQPAVLILAFYREVVESASLRADARIETMSPEETAIVDEARLFLDELFRQGVPIQNLLRSGTFPVGWSDRYLAFIERVSAQYGEASPLPREVLAVIYNASVYCTKRYHDWQQSSSSVNAETELLVNQVRWAGDQLVLGRYWQTAR